MARRKNLIRTNVINLCSGLLLSHQVSCFLFHRVQVSLADINLLESRKKGGVCVCVCHRTWQRETM